MGLSLLHATLGVALIVGIAAAIRFVHSHRSYFAEVRGEIEGVRTAPSAHCLAQTTERLGPYYVVVAHAADPAVTAAEDARLASAWTPPVVMGTTDQPVAIAQSGLFAYDRYLHTGDKRFLVQAIAAADSLVALQKPDGSWRYSYAFNDLQPGWSSAMAQGEAISLLLRIHQSTGSDAYEACALQSFEYMVTPVADGGTLDHFPDGAPILEEFPGSSAAPYTLNGTVFALWGIRDLALATGDSSVASQFRTLAAALASHLSDYDTGAWTRYALPQSEPMLASSFYHNLHITQMRVMSELTSDDRWTEAAERWERYRASRARRSAVSLWFADLVRRFEVIRARSGSRYTASVAAGRR